MSITNTYHTLRPMLAINDEKALYSLSHISNRAILHVTMNDFSIGREILPGANVSQCSRLLHHEDPVHGGYFLYDGVGRHDVSDRDGCSNPSISLSKDAHESLDDSIYLFPAN